MNSQLFPALAYGRCSTDKQDNSIEAQNQAFLRFATANNIPLPDDCIFLEEDTSGSIEFARRPKGARVLQLLKTGQARILIVPKIDRLGRKALDILNTIETVHKLGPDYRIYILDLGGNTFDTRNPMAGMIIAVLAYFAQMELERIRERIQSILDQKHTKGELCGTIPYGWTAEPTGQTTAKGVAIRKLVPAPAEQQWIRTMAAWRAAGLSYNRIAEKLNDAGVPTKTPKGAPLNQKGAKRQLRFASGRWSCGSVAHVLNNRYTTALLTPAATKAA